MDHSSESEACVKAMELYFNRSRKDISFELKHQWIASWIKAKEYYASLQPQGRLVPHAVAPGDKFS